MDLMIYGLERSGTNFTEAVMLENFQNIQFWNEHYPDALPTHKHFRLYDEKHFIPITQFLNNFHFPDFLSFDKKVNELTRKADLKYVISVKDPYAWYQSFMKLAAKGNYIPVRSKIANGQFMLDWNLFHKKWLQFADEAPERIKIIRYEDMINNTDESLNLIQSKFDLEAKSSSWHLPEKVGMSKSFNAKRMLYYKKGSFKDKFPATHMRVISEMLDTDVLTSLGYEKIDTEPTYDYQTNYIPTR
ncbi:sulfotransferase [Salibacteraceae bacterium]|nr:sulfotransferase [Salibacteraceae bacterium]